MTRTKTVRDPKPYPYIRAWGKRLGWPDWYIDGHVQAATDDAAPEDAVDWNVVDGSGRWVLLGELEEDVRRELVAAVEL